MVIAHMSIVRSFHGLNYEIPIEVWESPEGVCARVVRGIRSENDEMMLLAATEDPELDEVEMSAAKAAIWAALQT
jgi:hypothetical protein